MNGTTTATGKNPAGEDVTIEIPIPDANSAAEWNAAIASGAEKAGVEIPGVTKPAAAATTIDTTKKDDEPKLFKASLTVNGTEMIFEDADPVKVLTQYTAAVQAAQLAPAPAAATTQTAEDKTKTGLSAADMFDVGTKLISGDASGLDTLLEKSGAIGRYLESQGVSIEKLKAATEKTQTDTVHDAWKTATDQFTVKVKAGEVDFPGGQQNMKMMGITLAQLGLKPSAESMVKAWEHMKKENLVFPVEKQTTQQTAAATTQTATTTTKPAPSSTAIGASGGGKETQQPAIDANRKFEIDMTTLSPEEAARAHRELLQQGVKPEQITAKQ